MKKLLKSLVLFAAAAMALTSCENEAMNEGIEANDTYTMNFVAGAPESKTSVSVVDNKATFSWAEEDELFYFVQNTADGLKKGTNVSFKNNGGVAEITATFTEKNSPIVAVYPEAAWVSNTDDFSQAKLIVKKDQNLTANTFAPDADLMVSKVVTPENVTDTHLLQFTRLVAVGKMTLKNLNNGEIIEKVNFSIDSENALTGRLYIDLATGKVSEWGYYNNAEKSVELVNGSMATDVANDIYFTCMPATIAAGETFTVKVTTNKTIYTHSVTIPEGKSIDFTSGRVSAFSVNMASATREDNKAIALPWSEGFDSEDLSAYTIVNGSSDTKFYNENVAGGTKGEILIGKNGGSMTATIASDGTAKTLNLWFKSNNPSYISVSSATEGVTVTKLSNTGYTVALAEGVSTFKLTLANTTGSNARVDDIVLTEEAPAVEKLTIEGATLSFTVGETFVTGENFTVKAVYQNGVSEKVTATVDSSDVNMNAAGTYTVTVTYQGVTATYDVTIQSAGVQTKTIELTSIVGTFANNTITWIQDGVTIVQAKGSGSTAVSSSYKTLSSARIYQGHTLTFSCATNITEIKMVTKYDNYGKTATVDVGTLNNPKTSGCTITWTGSAKKIVLTNGSGQGGSQIQPSKITITYEVTSGGTTPEPTTPVDQTVTFTAKPTEVTVGETVTVTATANTAVTYTSSNTSIATVNETTGVVTGVAVGSVTITATAAATAEYNSATATHTITVKAAEQGGGDEPETPETKTYTETFSGLTSQQTSYDTTLNYSSKDVTGITWTGTGAQCVGDSKASKIAFGKNKSNYVQTTVNDGLSSLTIYYHVPFKDTQVNFVLNINGVDVATKNVKSLSKNSTGSVEFTGLNYTGTVTIKIHQGTVSTRSGIQKIVWTNK